MSLKDLIKFMKEQTLGGPAEDEAEAADDMDMQQVWVWVYP